MTSENEHARHWTDPALPGVDLLRARYVEKRFVRHTHASFVIGAITRGVEAYEVYGGLVRVGPGGLALVNPDTVHTGHAGVPEGWSYSVLYPSVDVVREIAAELTTLRGTPRFAESAVHDPETAGVIARVHAALEGGNALAADSLFRVGVAQVLRRHGGVLPARTRTEAGAAVARLAREVLEGDLVDPPSLERLAAGLGVSPFALLRAFRKEYGMPPHTWLTDARVRRARALLDAGTPPAEAALAVGFTDQPHLNRHFSRIIGVPPGAYRRERL
ncbi:AraC family transcriptional regulator [Streptomyces smaragdinus]|uniref:AraC family transcriptional regulator n=1 Tax=Streptomyces smaragdinus TaxID=2585196 RepID=UPI003899A74B